MGWSDPSRRPGGGYDAAMSYPDLIPLDRIPIAARACAFAAVFLFVHAAAADAAADAGPLAATAPTTAPTAGERPVTFNTNFEGGSLGRVEKLGPATFRCWVEGQHDERGRNRQASWYYFRLDHVAGRDLTLTMTDFVGEYNDTPGAVPMGPDIVPVFSEDGRTWKHFPRESAVWDSAKKELTLRLRPAADTVWIAHIPPYTPSDLAKLLADVRRQPHAVVEVIGRTARGNDLQMVTVTDPDVPDEGKRSVWLMARQHAWEAGTSYVMEGALRFVTSDEPEARELRRRVVFRFTPMVDVDGCLAGKVRFNANGYDVNRHWDEVDLRRRENLERMPEIGYAKKAIVAAARAGKGGRGIDLLLNLHNTETAEYMETHTQDEAAQKIMGRLFDLLVERTSFDPSRKLAMSREPTSTTNSLAREYGIPVALMEQRIATGKKLGHAPTVEDRLKFGRDLIAAMAEAVR